MFMWIPPDLQVRVLLSFQQPTFQRITNTSSYCVFETCSYFFVSNEIIKRGLLKRLLAHPTRPSQARRARHNLNFKGLSSRIHRELSRSFESTNISRDDLSTETGRSHIYVDSPRERERERVSQVSVCLFKGTPSCSCCC